MASINIKFPLRSSPKGAFETNDTTLEAVADDLKILIITNWGERPMNYDFGCDLRRVIFEFQGQPLQQMIEDSIRAGVAKWMPYVNVLDVVVEDSTNTAGLVPNQARIKIKFSVGTIEGSETVGIMMKA